MAKKLIMPPFGSGNKRICTNLKHFWTHSFQLSNLPVSSPFFCHVMGFFWLGRTIFEQASQFLNKTNCSTRKNTIHHGSDRMWPAKSRTFGETIIKSNPVVDEYLWHVAMATLMCKIPMCQLLSMLNLLSVCSELLLGDCMTFDGSWQLENNFLQNVTSESLDLFPKNPSLTRWLSKGYCNFNIGLHGSALAPRPFFMCTYCQPAWGGYKTSFWGYVSNFGHPKFQTDN